jgi:hypothetical protein
MPILSGNLSARWHRAIDPLPPNFAEAFERELRRHAFRPVDVEKGLLRSIGWVNIRQPLDAKLTLKKALFGGSIALGLRVDRVAVSQRLFRATLSETIAATMKEKKLARLTAEQRAAIEDEVRRNLLKAQTPSMAVHEMAWQLESGRVCFGATGDKLNAEFADLFGQTFGVGLEPQLPFLRAQRWAKRQRAERELLELAPAPYSPSAPAEVIEIDVGSEEEA